MLNKFRITYTIVAENSLTKSLALFKSVAPDMAVPYTETKLIIDSISPNIPYENIARLWGYLFAKEGKLIAIKVDNIAILEANVKNENPDKEYLEYNYSLDVSEEEFKNIVDEVALTEEMQKDLLAFLNNMIDDSIAIDEENVDANWRLI